MRKALLLTVALSAFSAIPASAQGVKVEFHDGRVTIEASQAPIRTVLNEWGKAGSTKIVGAERITGAPITVKLINVTEAQALETILRSVAGYMAAPRHAGAGASMYDRILVMATTSAPAAASNNNNARPAPNPPNAAFNGTQRFVPPQRVQRPEEPEQDEQAEPDENPPNPPVFTFPQPGQQNGMPTQPGQFVNAPPNTGQTITVNPANGQPANVNINGAPAAQPTGPVGVSTPGMMVNPPPPANTPNQPGMIRRPGGRQ